VREQSTKSGRPYVKLVFRPLPRDSALERLTAEEARVFVVAMEEVFGRAGEHRVQLASASNMLFKSNFEVSPDDAERGRRILEEYVKLYGAPGQPLPEGFHDSKFMTAFMLSTRHMPEGVRAGAQELFSSRTVVMAIIASGMTYLALWLAPDPVLSKAIASGITVGLMVIYGVSEIINVARAFVGFYQEVNAATTMEQLEAAAKRFGESMGKVGVRIMAMVASGALAKSLPNTPMPGLGALTRPPRQFVATSPSGVEVAVSVAEGASTQVNVSTGTAVLMGVSVSTAGAAARSSARTIGDCRPESNKGDARKHHIATDKNHVSDATGGPWTPKFEFLFRRAGMTLGDPANLVNIIGHQGPHSMEYHMEVYQRLENALGDCATKTECRARLVEELDRLAASICKPGSRLNKLLTKKP
jgi:hypothetical protein